MRVNIIPLGIALAVASGLAGCAPGPRGYAGWSDIRQQQANQDAYLARRNADAAHWQARTGNYWGAQQSQAAAQAEAAQARQEQAHAARDRFWSQF